MVKTGDNHQRSGKSGGNTAGRKGHLLFPARSRPQRGQTDRKNISVQRQRIGSLTPGWRQIRRPEGFCGFARENPGDLMAGEEEKTLLKWLNERKSSGKVRETSVESLLKLMRRSVPWIRKIWKKRKPGQISIWMHLQPVHALRNVRHM